MSSSQETALRVICSLVLCGQVVNLIAVIIITFANLIKSQTVIALTFLSHIFIYLITIGYSITLVQYIRNPESIFDEVKVDVYGISHIIADDALFALGVTMIFSILETSIILKFLSG